MAFAGAGESTCAATKKHSPKRQSPPAASLNRRSGKNVAVVANQGEKRRCVDHCGPVFF